ncbi:MAG TPA: hypothetical protein VE871_20640 [Longimicrobium sp.]|nr:hypothetical protein [Longimicrobium sp.]
MLTRLITLFEALTRTILRKPHCLAGSATSVLVLFVAPGVQAQMDDARSRIERVCGPESLSVGASDQLHPSNFVSVHEITVQGDRRKVHLAALGNVQGHPDFGPHSQVRVDRNSTLEITFAREWMMGQPDFRGNIHVTGLLNGEPLPIPGYSEVGQQADTGVVDLESMRAMLGSFCTLGSMEPRLSSELARVDSEVERTKQMITDEQRQQLNRVRSVRQEIAELEELRAGADSAEFPSLDRELGRRRRDLERVSRDPEYLSLLRTFTPQALPGLRVALEHGRPTFESMSAARHRKTLNVVARRLRRDPAVLAASSARLAQRVDSLSVLETLSAASSPETVERAAQLVETLQFDLHEVTAASRAYMHYLAEADLTRDPALLEQLKDSRVLLARHDVKPGDRVILTVLNQVEGQESSHRELDLDIRVDRFSWNSDVTDSFVFLRRLGADYDRVPESVMAVERSLAAAGTEQDTTLRISQGVNFELVPGVAYTWSHHSRGWWTWLYPSLGLNVSFPKFQTKTYRISRGAGADAEVSRTEETEANNFDLALGGSVSVFNGAIGLTMGRVMTVEDDPFYYGVSLSFLSLAKNAAKLFPGSN